MNSFLNAVIGLIFTWLVFSLGAMYLQEWLASRRKWRARMLETTIRNMLSDPELTDQFYSHPLIRNLYSGNSGVHKPSYIPSSQFAMAILDMVRTAWTEASLIQKQIYKVKWEMARRNKRKRKAIQKRLNMILAMTRRVLVSEECNAAISSSLDAIKAEISKLADDYPKTKPAVDKLLNEVKTQKGQIDGIIAARKSQNPEGLSQETTLEQIRLGVTALGISHPRLKQTLHMLLSDVEDRAIQGESGIVRSRQNVEEWFNSCMDRLSGWYKRRTQVMVTLIGFVLVLSINADSLLLAKQLWREPILSASLTNRTEDFVTQSPDGILPPDSGQLLSLQKEFEGINLPIGWISLPPLTNLENDLGQPPRACTVFPIEDKDIYGIQIARQCFPIVNAPRLDDLSGWLMKFTGLLLTGLAIAQGAPFWFDILKKIINVRTAGVKPAEIQNAVG
jgi:hypothetical protein